MGFEIQEWVKLKGTSQTVTIKAMYQIWHETVYITYCGKHYREGELEKI